MYNLDIKNDIGIEFTYKNVNINNSVIGKGAYGIVYKSKDEYDNDVAIKKCQIKNKGIPNLLELSIMSSIHHPNINNCYYSFADENSIQIIQDLAISDLNEYTRINKNNFRPPLDLLKYWMYQILQAVDALHENNIIHGDIKAENILLYDNNIVKLTDFSLAVKKYKKNQTYQHYVCTCTHRPLECYLNQEWDEKLDIWSLGCTFYEIAYGVLLFFYQGTSEKKNLNSIEKYNNSKNVKLASIKCLQEWENDLLNDTVNYSLKKEKNDDYISYEFCSNFFNEEMKEFNELVLSMLNIKSLRPSVKELLSSNFFKDIQYPIERCLIIKKRNKLTSSEKKNIKNTIKKFTKNDEIVKKCIELYSLTSKMYHQNSKNLIQCSLKTAACLWMISKMYHISKIINALLLCYPIHTLFEIELEICKNTMFKLF